MRNNLVKKMALLEAMKGAKYGYAIINSGLNMCVEN